MGLWDPVILRLALSYEMERKKVSFCYAPNIWAKKKRENRNRKERREIEREREKRKEKKRGRKSFGSDNKKEKRKFEL